MKSVNREVKHVRSTYENSTVCRHHQRLPQPAQLTHRLKKQEDNKSKIYVEITAINADTDANSSFNPRRLQNKKRQKRAGLRHRHCKHQQHRGCVNILLPHVQMTIKSSSQEWRRSRCDHLTDAAKPKPARNSYFLGGVYVPQRLF